jgi:glutathione synthase/RimK-type ligase-like ATP-grasp enzyme
LTDIRLVTAAVLPDPDRDLDRVADGLAARGVEVDVAYWHDAAIDWSDAPLTVLRSPWDYVDRLDEFLAWVERIGALTALWNPPSLVRWNTHKAYLLELSSLGAPVVPTVLLAQDGAASLDGIADAQGWNAVVVKPAVGVGAVGAGRFEVGDGAGQRHLDRLLQSGDVLVQPYASAIERDGEISIVTFDGRASHAVRKTPAAGEFRIHEQYGGALTAIGLGDAPVALAERVVASLPTATLYARVDLVPMAGLWHVVEVEATEPRLYLEHAPTAATETLVVAIITRLDRPAP